MFDLASKGETVRIWALAEAPIRFREALSPPSELDRWVAHVPASLLDEPLVALLSAGATASEPLETVFFEDGSRLLSGKMPPCRPAAQQAPNSTAAVATASHFTAQQSRAGG